MLNIEEKFRERLKGVQILLSNSQAVKGRKVKQEQKEISRNHIPRLFLGSVEGNARSTDVRSSSMHVRSDFAWFH